MFQVNIIVEKNTDLGAKKASTSKTFEEGKRKQSENATYVHGNLSATGSDFQENQNVNIISTFSKFENPSNHCWFNSVLQVIIHALKQHEENVLDWLLPSVTTMTLHFLISSKNLVFLVFIM